MEANYSYQVGRCNKQTIYEKHQIRGNKKSKFTVRDRVETLTW